MDINKTIQTLYDIIQILDQYKAISSLPDCNTCTREPCEYIPLAGERVRINCPFYQKGEKNGI